MSRSWWILSLLTLSLVLGCGAPDQGSLGDDDDDDDIAPPGDDDDAASDDDDATDDDDDTAPVVAAVVGVHPADGAADHFVSEALWVDFDVAAEDAVVSLVGPEDEDLVLDHLWLSETRLLASPENPLGHATAYTATVTWAEGAETHSWSFETSTVGGSPSGLDLTGNTYAMDITAGLLVAPPGAEAFLGQIAATFLIGVVGQTESEIDLLGSLAVEGSSPLEQNLCNPSFNLSEKAPTVWQDPYFSGGPVDVAQQFEIPSLGPLDITFNDVHMSGVAASSDNSGVMDIVTEGAFSAYVDMRDVGFDCSMLAGLLPGLACSECPGEPGVDQCVVFDIIDIPGVLVEGLTLVPVSEADVENNPDCN